MNHRGWMRRFLLTAPLLCAAAQVWAGPDLFPSQAVSDTTLATEDCYISAGGAHTKYGNTDPTQLKVMASTVSTRQRTILKTSVPAGATGGAILSLHINLTLTAKVSQVGLRYPTLEVRPLMHSWTETGACWDSSSTGALWKKSGADSFSVDTIFDTTATSSQYDASGRVVSALTSAYTAATIASGSVMSFDLTDIGRKWATVATANNGVMIECEDGADVSYWSAIPYWFASAEHATTASRPRFIWVYIPADSLGGGSAVHDTVTVGNISMGRARGRGIRP